MTTSLMKKGVPESHFLEMLLTAILLAVASIPLFGLWMGFLIQRAGARRSKLDIFFASAPIGIPVFCFALALLNMSR